MKKFFYTAFISLVIIPVSLHAGSIGGVTTQGEGKWGVGAEIDWNFESDLELDKIDLGLAVEDVEAEDQYNIAIKGVYGLTNNIDIYAKLGYMDFSNTGNLPALGNFDADADADFSYAIGAKGAFPADYGIVYGADFQYQWSKNDIDISVAAISDQGEVDFKKWHVAPFIAKPMETMTPYAGFKYTQAKYEHDFDTLGAIEFENEDEWGLFLGSDIMVDERTTANVELRLLDETAITAGLTYKY
ncbi:MAG: hypothetical protein JW928_01180 [Candidatus Aureabacteria bacterium]|nr:hypothetical protein [Candidatus Auribacterota bacterium]